MSNTHDISDKFHAAAHATKRTKTSTLWLTRSWLLPKAKVLVAVAVEVFVLDFDFADFLSSVFGCVPKRERRWFILEGAAAGSFG